jgi:dihydrofolate synthase/folylpolyglutamate synthase
LTELVRFGQRLGLERMASFLRWLGDPHQHAPVIHVAGTNGKGSVVRMAGAMLRAQGLRVGEYTSPHLQQVNERIVVDGKPISDTALTELLQQLVAARDVWIGAASSGTGGGLTYFEVMTAAAFLHFCREDVDIVVLEVGLGGRLDATNVVTPAVSAIVSIGLDHTQQLGPDVASIAAEKAGIVKPGVPVVVGPLEPAALRVVRSIAAERDAPLVAPPDDFRVDDRRGQGFCYRGPERDLDGLELELRGGHQAWNAGVALALMDRLPAHLRPDDAACRAGLSTVQHPGRIERIEANLWLDCAHNPVGAEQLAIFLRDLPADVRPRTLVLGMSGEKDARGVARALAPLMERVFTTHCAHPRAMSAGELATHLVDLSCPVLPAGPIEEALPMVRQMPGPVLVAGSVFLVGAVRDLLGR